MTPVDLDPHLDAVYAGITDDAAFAAIPMLIARQFGGDSGWLLLHDPAGTTILAAGGIETGKLGDYRDHFASVDPYTANITGVAPGVAIAFERLVTRDALVNTEFYNDYLRPNRFADHAMGGMLPMPGAVAAVAFHRLHKGAFGAADERVLQPMMAPLRRVIATRLELARRDTIGAQAAVLMDDAVEAIFLCRRDAAVVYRNRAAVALPRRVGAIAGGRLVLASATLLPAVAAEVARTGAIRRITLASPGGASGAPACVMTVSPTPDPATVMVVIADPDRHLLAAVERARQAWGFTASETALAESLMRGRTIEAHAGLRGTSAETVRKQVRALLAKTGTHRQAELVALIAR